MSSQIDIIQTGYAEMRSNFTMAANGSCCLVRSNQENILFDTMGPWQKDILIEGLEKFKIYPDDIHYVVCSHSHADHIGNLNLFVNNCKRHIVGTSVYYEDLFSFDNFESQPEPVKMRLRSGQEVDRTIYKDYKINDNITVEPTPGHTLECVSMVVNNCDKYGTVALVGDLYETQEDLNNENIWLAAGSQKPESQRIYRDYIYNKCDYIIPGHGPMFKVDVNKR